MSYGYALWQNSKKDEQDVDAAIEQAKVSLAVLDKEPLPLKWQEHIVFERFCPSGRKPSKTAFIFALVGPCPDDLCSNSPGRLRFILGY
jgi:hypothetical protein